jgi:hypothetical protein
LFWPAILQGGWSEVFAIPPDNGNPWFVPFGALWYKVLDLIRREKINYLSVAISESFERIRRSNLVGMGTVPCRCNSRTGTRSVLNRSD